MGGPRGRNPSKDTPHKLMSVTPLFVEARAPTSEVDSVLSARPAMPPKRVLIVDHDTQVRRSLATVFETEGFDVFEADNGLSAMAQAIFHEPGVVVLDLEMPRMNGWTIFHRLNDMFPSMPVIVITALSNQYPEAVRLRVDAFMEKPLSFSALVDEARRLLDEAEDRHLSNIQGSEFTTKYLPSNEP